MISYHLKNKNWLIPVSLSVLIHLIFLAFFGFYTIRIKFPPQFIELYIEQKVSDVQTLKRNTRSEPVSDFRNESKTAGRAETGVPQNKSVTVKNKVPEKTAWQTFVDQTIKSHKFIADSLKIPSEDSSLSFLIPQFSMDKLVSQKDPMADAIYEHGTGGVSLRASQTPVTDRPEKVYSVQLDFMPDPVHMMIMANLFDQGTAHQNNIYASLPDSVRITAEKLDESLEFLYKKGLLTRKKISAEHKIIALFFPIEMSQKNRKNPLYLYRPAVDKTTLKIYLNSLRNEPQVSDSKKTKPENVQKLVEIITF